ncbi:hydrogen peroxide-inducible genes activator [Pseudothioclava nitratireducens]|uniref:hydrogen peroxide-inducible genes activator n=1 Tax=Pseudothioclava nitratireducens TaxID=1928646 RepID=UPI0023D9AB53|nr:hydrogen peroxide-inducible genes activator [Defluviimonas nitratireducens]MDF1621221.1 LysR substrate-binding domain-containing protein [Defluviimonas nitratireducens]
MIGLTLKQLRYFEALARHRHFGHAADSCGISQPALSLQIKELEALLGAPLIERGARQVRLSALGEELSERARAILGAVEEIDDLARTARGPLSGRLRLGVIPTIAPYLLPGAIKRLGAAYPALDLRPREAITQTLIRDLNEGRLDLAIVALPVSEPALHEEPLFEEEFMLVRPVHEANLPVPNLDNLLDMRLLLLEEGHCFRDQALSFCTAPSKGPRELMEGSSLNTLVQMVGAGIGVTLIPEMAVPIETRSAEVSVTQLPAPRPKRTVGIVWRKSSPLSAQFGQIADLLRP